LQQRRRRRLSPRWHDHKPSHGTFARLCALLSNSNCNKTTSTWFLISIAGISRQDDRDLDVPGVLEQDSWPCEDTVAHARIQPNGMRRHRPIGAHAHVYTRIRSHPRARPVPAFKSCRGRQQPPLRCGCGLPPRRRQRPRIGMATQHLRHLRPLAARRGGGDPPRP